MLGQPSVGFKTPVDLVTDVEAGRIRVPPFQRNFRWQSKDVIKLFDSLMRGYPIGNLLLWEREAPAQRLALGPLVVEAPQQVSALWVVDGQQRITSIVGALTSAAISEDPRFRIYLDTLSREFHSLGLRQQPPSGWVPVSILLDTAKLIRWTRDNVDRFSEHQINAIDAIAKVIREYRIPTYEVQSADEDELKEIFARMNETGRPLSKAESFQALHYSLAGDEAASLAGVRRAPVSLGFGAFDERLALRCILAYQGGDIFRDDFHGEFSSDSERDQAYRGTAAAARDAVVFIQGGAGVPHLRLLPYTHVIPVLVRFVREHGAPEGRATDLLRRWVWRGAVAGASARGISVVDIRQQVYAAGEGSAIDAARALLERVPRHQDFMADLRKVNLNHAMTKINALGLLSAGPIDLLTGEPVEPGRLLEDGGLLHEIVAGPGAPASFANRAVTSAHRGRGLVAELLRASPDVRATHLVDEDGVRALSAGDASAFFAQRASLTEKAIRAHVARMAEWGARDSQEISAIVKSVA